MHGAIKMCMAHVHSGTVMCMMLVQINAQCVHSVRCLLTHTMLCAILVTTGETAGSCYELCIYQRRYNYE